MKFKSIFKSSLSLVAITVLMPVTTYAIANKLDTEIGSAITLEADNNKATIILHFNSYLDLYDGRVKNLQAFGYDIKRVANQNNSTTQLRFYSQSTGELLGIKSF